MLVHVGSRYTDQTESSTVTSIIPTPSMVYPRRLAKLDANILIQRAIRSEISWPSIASMYECGYDLFNYSGFSVYAVRTQHVTINPNHLFVDCL